MKFEFIFTGKTTEKWVEDGCLIYLNRIKKYTDTDIKIINIHGSAGSHEVQRKREAALILEKLSVKDLVILLDEKGKQFTSPEFAVQMSKLMSSGKAKIIFIVGGAYGTDIFLQKRANLVLSFSKMTFTHQMIRLLLFEQVYRAFTILKNEKYHH